MSTAEVTHLRVMGTNGTVEWRGDDALELRPLTGPATRQDHPRGNSVLAELEAFADAVAGRAPYPISVQDVRDGIAALEAMIRATESDGFVKVG
jgi:predicted dehydrogenase